MISDARTIHSASSRSTTSPYSGVPLHSRGRLPKVGVILCVCESAKCNGLHFAARGSSIRQPQFAKVTMLMKVPNIHSLMPDKSQINLGSTDIPGRRGAGDVSVLPDATIAWFFGWSILT